MPASPFRSAGARDAVARGAPASTYDLIADAAARFGDAPALSFVADAADFRRVERWSFRELLAQVTRAANVFHDAGVGPGDVVAYALPNLPQTHFTLWGAEAAGVALAVNPALGPEAIADLLRAAGARVLVTTAEAGASAMLESLSPHLSACPSLAHAFVVGGRGPCAVAGRPVRNLEAAMAGVRGDALESGRRIAPGESSSWFCTGGTTGAPKIARRTHGNETSDAAMMLESLGAHAGPGVNFLCGLPLFHVNAAMITGLLPWLAGSHVVLGPKAGYRDRSLLSHFWRIVEAHRINVFSGVPTVLATLLETPLDGCDVSSLDFAVCGAAPMPVELFRRFEAATGVRILEAYGLTESACVASLNPVDGERRIGSIGQALPGQEMKCVILDGAGAFVRDAGTDEVGVVALRGPNVFGGYKDAAHDAGIWIDCGDAAPWFNTGDLGRRDADGYFWLTGRRKQLIIRGGHNIDPATIEEPLHRHPAVALAAAVGRPDAHAGEVPVAYVQLRPGTAADEAELLAFAAGAIAERAAVPRAVRIVPAIPVTAVGKIFKPALVEREVEDVVRAEASAAAAMLKDVRVATDARRGLVAAVRLQGSSPAFRAAMGRYAFAADIREG